MDYILEKIFTNVSLQTYTIVATILFTIIFFFFINFLIKFFASENTKNTNHFIVKLSVIIVSLIAAILAQGVIAELYFFKDWECPLTGTCI